MKQIMVVLTLAFISAMGGTALGQSKPGEGWYDSGTGQANAPGTSGQRELNGAGDVAKDNHQDRQENLEVQVISESGDFDMAVQAAKDKLISMGAKAIVVAAVTRFVGEHAGFVFKIAVGVSFPATHVADGERRLSDRERGAPPPTPSRSMGKRINNDDPTEH